MEKEIEQICEHENEIVSASDGKTLLVVVVCKKCGQSHTERYAISARGRSPLA